PLKVRGRVKAITDGQFVVTGPMATGVTIRMGRTAVLDTGNMQIVVSEKRSEPFDLGVFTHCGIDPRRKKYVLIKSRQHFRAGFEPIAKHSVMCDGDGCTASDLKLFKDTSIKRPLCPSGPHPWPARKDVLLIDNPTMAMRGSEGVTTVVCGNCGVSAAPYVRSDSGHFLSLIVKKQANVSKNFAEFAGKVEAAKPAINGAFLIGHGTLRM